MIFNIVFGIWIFLFIFSFCLERKTPDQRGAANLVTFITVIALTMLAMISKSN